ncbi:MAG TPA: M23 family metallopeptidase, partial [Beutenbergiaceae bacterium]|nr:M23 family metallopeptidase [Beutenbergiaceae bacterium]
MGARITVGLGAVALAALVLTAPWASQSVTPGAPPALPAAGAEAEPDPGAELAPGHYDWPLAGEPAVLREFEAPPQPWSPGHRGVDLGAEAGEPVLAAGAGVVAFTGWVAGRPVVSIDHDDGIRTTYEPVEAAVTAGTSVPAGTVIGQLHPAGEPHCATGDCLHWGARIGAETYLDPLSLLQREPPVIRLYPAAP